MRPAHDPARDQAVALTVLALMTRRRSTFPLTTGYMQHRAAALGYPVGEARAGQMISYLKTAKRLVQVGRYRGKLHGFWVAIYKGTRPVASVTSSVRRNQGVKGLPWWQHPLFGNPEGRPPPGSARKQRQRWRSPPYLALERERT